MLLPNIQKALAYYLNSNDGLTQSDEDNLAREVLALHPELKREFDDLLQSDPDFNYAPEAIVDWIIETVICK